MTADTLRDRPPSDNAPLSIRPETSGPTSPAAPGSSARRLERAFLASAASHVVAVILVVVIIGLAPDRVLDVVEPNREDYGIVWLPEPGPGGGGGGGGNESLEVPRQVELEGPDDAELSVPVEPEPDYVEPEIEPETVETQALNIPAVSVASASATLPGVMERLTGSSAASQGSGTGGGGGSGEGTGVGPGTGSGLGPGEGGNTGGGVYRPGTGIVNPRLLRKVDHQYTDEALRARIEGEVWLDIVVLPDGTVGDVTVTKSLDPVFGLDEEAIKAARQWRFEPGTLRRSGEPVAVRVSLVLEFNLL